MNKKPIIQHRPWHSEVSSPFNEGFRYAVMCYSYSCSFVVCLLSCCGPSAVVGRVVAIGVDTVKRVFTRWSFAHVSNKVFKREPTLTNRNSSATVIFKPCITGVATPRAYPSPRGVSAGVHFAMAFFDRCSAFFLIASTRTGVAAGKARLTYFCVKTTIANTVPHSAGLAEIAVRFFSGKGNSSKSAEFLTSQVDDFTHNILRLNIDRIKWLRQTDTVSEVRSLNLDAIQGVYHQLQ